MISKPVAGTSSSSSSEDEDEDVRTMPLKVSHYLKLFQALGIGLGLSTVVFGIELILGAK